MRTLVVTALLCGCTPAMTSTVDAPLHWDFSQGCTLRYDYEQHLGASTSLETAPVQDSLVRGAMDVVARGDGTAHLLLRDMMLHHADHEDAALPPALLPDVREDGSTAIASSDPRLLILAVLAPLPHRALEIGQSDEVLLAFPVNAGGSTLTAHGGARVTLRGYADEGGTRCAILDTVTDVGRLDAPSSLGEYDASLHGTSTVAFSLSDHALVRASMSLTMTTRMQPSGSAPTESRMDTTLTVRRAQ